MATTPPDQDQTPPAADSAPETAPPPAAPAPSTQSNTGLSKTMIISICYLGSFVTGISGLVGFILAFVWQNDVRGTWEESHLQYHVITGIGSLVGFIVGFILTFVLIGLLVFPIVAIWMLVRSVIPIMKAQNQEPMPDPKTFLF